MTVSIILPTYNRSGLIKRAVKSVLNQSHEAWELLIIDDGSEDRTRQICAALSENETRIKYFYQDKSGLPAALNKGIELSRNDVVTFLGSDDEYLPSHLKLRVDFLKEHNNVDMLHGGVKIIGNPYVKDKNDLTKLIHLNECIIGGTFFGRRNVFVELGGFKNIPYSEDSEFFERASKKFKVRKVNFETYVYYRDTENSISNNI